MKMIVSFPPHDLARHTLKSYNLTWLVAAAPAAAAGVCFYGLGALLILILTTLTAVVVEALVARIGGMGKTVGDGQAALMGLLLGLTLSPTVPWWLAVIASAMAVVLGKMLFGGNGFYPFHPVLVGWVVAYLSWPELMSAYVAPAPGSFGGELSEAVRPYLLIRQDPSEILGFEFWSRLVGGSYAGPIGGSSGLAVLLGAVWLFIRGYLPPAIPLAVLATAGVTAELYHLAHPDLFAPWWFHLTSGTILLAALLLAPEPTTSPVTRPAMILFGLGIGLGLMIFRVHGTRPEAAFYAILIFNALTPILDRIRPRPYGRKAAEG